MRYIFLSIVLLLNINIGHAQDKWSLKRCIDYAIKNNISIEQLSLQVEQAEISHNSARNRRLPSFSASLGGNTGFGRGLSRDGTYVDNSQFSSSGSLSAGVPVYQGSQITNDIKSSHFDLLASQESYEAACEDLSVNIAMLYVQVLYQKELLTIAKKQVEISAELVVKSKLLLQNGKLTEEKYYESLSINAQDRLSETEVFAQYRNAILELTQALNLPFNDDFDIVIPEQGKGSDLSEGVSSIYNSAIKERPVIKTEELKLLSYNHQYKSARGARLPQISFSAGYSNSFYHAITGDNIVNTSFTEQLSHNGSQSLGFSISIPIFNQFTVRNSIRRAGLAIKNQELAIESAKQQLYNKIEKAYQNAHLSTVRYDASIIAEQAARKSFEYAEKKVKLGVINIYDYNDSKNKLTAAASNLARAKYELMFNNKVLRYYEGKPIVD